MLPKNPFLQLVLPRSTAVLDRIRAAIWTEVAEVRCEFGGAFREPVSFAAAQHLPFQPIKLPFLWGKIFDQGWFRLRWSAVATPEPLYLNWRDQGEGTAYVDGIPYYGFDVAHRHCLLPPGTKELLIEGLCLQSAIWHPEASGLCSEGSKLECASLCTRNDLAWEVYHDTEALVHLAIEEAKVHDAADPPKLTGAGRRRPLESASVLYRRLLRALDDTFDAFDVGGLVAAKESLADAYRQFRGANERISAVLTGHAHIDLVWLWPEKSGEYKAVHTFSTMNRLMDSYPEFVFGYSQPASYDAVERISPSLMSKIRGRMGEGRWEAVGATYVEPDTQLACGECLARCFILGQQEFLRIKGEQSNVLWLPDVFGYSGCLPQIMVQSGVKYFFTTKLTWSEINPFPYSSFVWRGVDGSAVLAHVTHDNGYVQTASAGELRRGARAYRQSDVHDEFLAPTGFGDGGGGVTEEMCERARRFRSLAGMPAVRWGKIGDFFEHLDEKRASLPVYQGELYLEYHRGVFTTHGELKAVFRRCERALQAWEAARCAVNGRGLPREIWRRMIFAQFHDYIPGSSIWEVYEEGVPELSRISQQALCSASEELGRDGAEALFNPLPLPKIVLFSDSAGAAKAVELPPLSGRPIADLPMLKPAGPLLATQTQLESARVSASFDSRGRISRILFDGRTIAMQAPLADMMLYADCPSDFDAWNIDRHALSCGRPAYLDAGDAVVSLRPLEGTVSFAFHLGEHSSGFVRYRLDAIQPILHIEYEIDWHEKNTLLRVLFPTAYAGKMARFGAPFGSVLRSQQAGETRDEAMFECPASRWAIVADDGEAEGLGVVTEAKYGFSCRDGVLGVSLLRSPRIVGGETAPRQKMFPPEIRQGEPRLSHTDLGRHVIRLALSFQSTDQPRELQAAALAETLFTDTVGYNGEAVGAGYLGMEGGQTLIPCWAKPADDGRGWILRLHEVMGRRGVAVLKLADGCSARRTDLAESSDLDVAVTEISFRPYELVSLRITGHETGFV